METWKDLSTDSRDAAQHLLTEGRWRSSVSRSYYAAYAAVTAELVARKVTFPLARGNPDHHSLPKNIREDLTRIPITRRRDLSHIILRLRAARIEADYMPVSTVGRDQAVEAMRDMKRLLWVLEDRK